MSTALLVLLLASGVVNVLLARRVVALTPPAPGLAAGTALPPLSGIRPDGRPVTLDYAAGGRPTVLYYFSPTCGWCERNWPNVRALVEATRERFRWVAVAGPTADDLAAFAAARRLDLDVVANVPLDLLREYRFAGTPQTLVVGTDGRVIAHWLGAFRDEGAREIERFFGVRLPGLEPPHYQERVP